MRRAAGVAALAALITLFTHGTAAAATALVKTGTVFYVAGAGEANDLEISEVGGQARLVDAGATITPGAGCTAVTPNEVMCTHTFVHAILGNIDDTAALTGGNVFGELSGGAGDDTLTACSTCRSTFSGGDGADHLVSGDVRATLDGGAGNDVLDGGAGNQWLGGGTGNDLITAGPGADMITPGPGTDGVDGGGNRDTLRYTPAAGRVIVDLKNGYALGQGPDNFDNVEGIIGSRFGDDLRGNHMRNQILGGDGADVLRGRGTPDILFAGDGNDIIYAVDGHPDEISGGPGFDRAHVDRGLDRVQRVERLF
jgi:Ca2+-binding RTX toxin-like protein